jgi:type IV fimbrial biogenesis protein FimU
MQTKRRSHQRGFTLFELVLVIVIIGLFSALAIPKINSPVSYTTQSRAEAFASDLRHAKALATASGRCTQVDVVGTQTLVVKKPNDVPTPVAYPPCSGSVVVYTSALDANTSVTGPATSLYFNSVGAPSAAATYTLVATGGGTKYVGVTALTGSVVICTSLPCP